MFIITQDGKRAINSDCIAEITTSTPAPCIIAVMKYGKEYMLAGYDDTDWISRDIEFERMIKALEKGERVYRFPGITSK